MSNHITVQSRTQHIVIEATSKTASVINAGPQGPGGVDAGLSPDAEDVSLADAGAHFTAADVEAALAELAVRVEALEGQPQITVSADPPSNPDVGDIWVDT